MMIDQKILDEYSQAGVELDRANTLLRQAEDAMWAARHRFLRAQNALAEARKSA